MVVAIPGMPEDTIRYPTLTNINLLIGASVDRNTVTGLILIFLFTLAWFYYTAPSPEQIAQQQREQAVRDSIAAAQTDTTSSPSFRPTEEAERPQEAIGSMGFFAPTDSLEQID